MDHTKIAALKPPPGVKLNFVNPPSYDGAGIATTAIYVTLVTLAVGVRLLTRGWVMKELATEVLVRHTHAYWASSLRISGTTRLH